MMMVVMLSEVVMVSLWMVLILIISMVRKLIVLVRSVMLLGISNWWNVECVVVRLLLFLKIVL